MAHTNSTEHYSLPQFVGTDKPSWLTDINNAFEAIDNAIYAASQSGGEGGGGSDYVLPVATKTSLGGVKIGDGLAIDANGLLSANPQSYNIPPASTTQLGGIKASTSVIVAQDGTATVPTGSNEQIGLVKGGLNVVVTNNGQLALNLVQGIPETGAVEGQLYYEVEE